MNRNIWLFVFIIAFNSAAAQNKAFRLDLAIGLLFPTGNSYLDQRFVFATEPKYSVTDQIVLGLRLEVAPNSNFAGTSDPFTVKSVSSYLLIGEYFIKTAKKLRPFIGFGTGMFHQTLRSSDNSGITTKENSFGISTRAGLERNRLRLALEYNTTFKTMESNLNHLTLKFGVFLWGNPKGK